MIVHTAVRAALLGGICIAALSGAHASAQIVTASAIAETAAADDAGSEAEIIVTGSRPIAESQAAALEIQRNSDSLVSVLSADAVGRLPDQNIAQAVSRLPGVSVQRDQGQARYINLRGAPLNWTTLSFDGIFVVSPEGRDARFDSIPSAIASQVVVQKAVTPDLNGETIAGNVNIVTRSPFDYKGFHLATKLGAGYVELGGGSEVEGSLVVSDRWETGIGDIGLLVSGSYYRRNMVTDNFEIDWEEVPQDLRPAVPGEESPRIWAREIENKFYRLTRKNYSASARLEWRPDSDNKLFVNSVYTIFADDELRDNYRIDADDQQNSSATVNALKTPCVPGVTTPPPATTGYADVCTGNTPLLGTIYGVDFDARFRQTAFRQSVFTNTIGGDHILGDVTIKWRGNYTRSEDDRSLPYLHTYQSPSFGSNGTGAVNRVTADYDLRDKNSSQVRLFRTLRSSTGVLSRGAGVSDFQSFPNAITSATALDALDVTNAYTAKLEAAWNTTLFGDTTFRFGGQFDQRTKEANENLLSASGATLNAALTAQGTPLDLTGILGNDPFKGKIRPGYILTHFSDSKAQAILSTANSVATFKPQNANFYNVREEIWSGYAMGTTRFDWGNIVYGARVEHIKNRGTAFAIIGSTEQLVTVENSKTLVFPSAHLNWNPRDDMKVRLSFNTGAARPDYTVSRPNLTVNDANETISGGNPLALPERAKGVDLYWEWYIAPAGFVSLGAFYKDVSDVLFQDSTVFGLDVLNTQTLDRSQYDFNTTVNGGDGHIAGVEAAVQLQLDPFLDDDQWYGGFGIQANVTYTDSEATTPDGRKIRFPGTSQWTYNIGPYYEKYGVSIRASYQKRTDWLDAIGSSTDTGGDIYWATDDELDVSARYAINANFEIYADASNLLNGPGRRFAGISQRTIERETFGARYSAGIRLTY
nr:TonB-dependent receptor [Polymorphobacter sp.]